MPSGSTVRQYGAYGQPGDSHFLGWGAWDAGTTRKQGINSGNEQALTAVHYIMGRANSSYGWTGSATYKFIGGTNPTATSSSGTVVGSIDPSSNLIINFSGSPQVTSDLKLSFNGSDVFIKQTGYISGGKILSGEQSGTNPDSGMYTGILSGNRAERAGIVYGASRNGLGQIRGAAAFQTSTPPQSCMYPCSP
jgi:hypothetical protein